MYNKFKIYSEYDKCLRKKNENIVFPLSDYEKKMIKDMLIHLRYSQIPKKSEQYDLRPGMGLAAPQVGINKKFFVVVHEVSDGVFDDYVLINPKLISHSEELIYASGGEGCLSVERPVDGITPRYARVTMQGYDIDGNLIKIRGREELAIAMQHEFDHLNGIMFYDKIDPKNPFKNQKYMREI